MDAKLEPQNDLIRAFIFTLKSKGVTAYMSAAVPDSTPSSYVVIQNIELAEDRTNKSDNGYSVTVLFDCVSTYPRNVLGDPGQSNALAHTVIGLFDDVDGLSAPPFQILCPRIRMDTRQDIRDDALMVWRRVLSIEFDYYQHTT